MAADGTADHVAEVSLRAGGRGLRDRPDALWPIRDGILAIMAINTLNARLVPPFGSDRLLRWGAALVAVAGEAAAVAGRTDWGGLLALALSMLLFCGLTGLIVANSLAGAFAAWPDRAGAASALVGAMIAGSGIIGSALFGTLADGTAWPLGLTMGLPGMGSFACTLLLPRTSMVSTRGVA